MTARTSARRESAPEWPGAPQRLRAAVRRELVARQLDEQLGARFPVGRRLRVLDVGLAQGTQALRLARAGHEVTGVDDDPEVLQAVHAALEGEPEGVRERLRTVRGDGRQTGAHFSPGTFDAVLCHGVLMNQDDPVPMLAGLARVLASGGLLSLLVRNAGAPAMRPGLAGDWTAARAAFDTDHGTGRLGLPALSTTLAGLGARLHTWYGVRVFTDIAPDSAGVPDDAEFEQLLAVEEQAGRTDPYRSVAALLHLCGVRGTGGCPGTGHGDGAVSARR